ncbi:MAG TPA: hypothetical protein VFF30_11525 [Nitrososphaerales archaeon]|nr:hypothetical protein [Nitrososphaerales archaeon]
MSVRRMPLIEPEWNQAPLIEPEWRQSPLIEPEWEAVRGFGRVMVADFGSSGPAIQTLW